MSHRSGYLRSLIERYRREQPARAAEELETTSPPPSTASPKTAAPSTQPDPDLFATVGDPGHERNIRIWKRQV